MTEAQVLAQIMLYIVTNGNNEIKAAVFNPILRDMLRQPNQKIGELSDLDTVDQSSIVNAINELVNAGTGGFQIHSGTDDPNVIPPGSFGIGDWYIRNGNSIYQFNGASWILLTQNDGTTNLSTSQDAVSVTIESDTGTDAVIPLGNGTLAGASLNNYSTTEKSKLASLGISILETFTYVSGPFAFTLSKEPNNVDVYVNRVWQLPIIDYDLTGDEVTIMYDLEEEDKITVRLY